VGSQVAVADRTALILDIFSQRALTREGKLQVRFGHLAHGAHGLESCRWGVSVLAHIDMRWLLVLNILPTGIAATATAASNNNHCCCCTTSHMTG
jgi:hypothetical protein